jgi:hypothetical protein
MIKNLTTTIAFISIVFSFSFTTSNVDFEAPRNLKNTWNQHVHSNYDCIQDTTLSQKAFDYGLRGYYTLKNEGKLINEKYLTIVDFTQHSSNKRLYVIDMSTMDVVHKTYCSHGKNTGGSTAEYFSNKSGSLQSSLGFFLTSETYSGKFDYALRLDGLESTNYKARERGIVMHGAEYATERFLKRNNNVLGRSYGCPAVPMDEARIVIDLIKEGSCFYIYADQLSYKQASRYIKPERFLPSLEEII